MRTLLASVIVFLAIGAVAAQSQTTIEEYEIYGLVLTEFFRDGNRRNSGSPEEHFVIASKTMTVDSSSAEEEVSSLYKSFNNRNKDQASLERRFPVRFSYSIVDEQVILLWAKQDQEEFDAKMKAATERALKDHTALPGDMCGAEWERFHSRFPKSFGYYRLSRIGFSRDHRWAYLRIDGKGSSWDWSSSYWVRWTRRGWRTYKSGGGGGIC